MKKALVAFLLLASPAMAENIYWQVGSLSLQLPNSGSDILPLLGYDFRFKQTLLGVESSFLNIHKELDLQLGGCDVAPAQTNAQPYIGVSEDLKAHLPALASLTDLAINVSTRYNTAAGGNFAQHLGAIFALSYKLP